MRSRAEDDDLELRHYVAVLWHRKLILVSTVLLVVIAAVGWSVLEEPRYRSTAEVLLQGNVSEEIFSPDPETGRVTSANRSRVQTEIEVMKSRSVRDAVEEELDRRPKVSIRQRGDTDVVAITVTNADPDIAAEDAQTYAEVFVETRRQQLIDDLLNATTQVQAELDSIREQITAAQVPLVNHDAAIAAAEDAATRRALEDQREAIASEVDRQVSALRSREITYSTQIDNLRLATNITQTGGAQVVSDAVVPNRAFSPQPLRNAAVALALGLVLGVALAFLRDHYDDTIKSKDDLENTAHGLPVLGLIPTVSGWKNKDKPLIIAQTSPRSVAAEAYRTLRTSIQFIGLERSLKILQVTSPNSVDGKTTTLANLAVTLARVGRRVVVVDCDLRRPRMHTFFGLENTAGFTSVLLGDTSLADAVQRVPGEPRLAVLVAGPPPPNPSELLSYRRTAEIFNTLATEADYVLIDGPPVLPVTDALVLSANVDGVIVISTAKQTTRRSIDRTLELLEQVEAPVIGAILNAAEQESIYAYRYGNYGYTGYVQPDAKPGRRGRRAKRKAAGDGAAAPSAPEPGTPSDRVDTTA